MSKPRVPAVDGWFRADEAKPALLGTRCAGCGSVFFPREETFCRNPGCASTKFDEVELSTRGRLWSYTNNCYAPPAPFVFQAADLGSVRGAVNTVQAQLLDKLVNRF